MIIIFYKMREGGSLTSKKSTESFVSSIFEKGQRVFLCASVLSIVINGTDQVVTGGILRHSRGEKSDDCTLNTVIESISFDLAFSYCLPWLRCLFEIMGNSFFYDMVLGFSADQTPRHPFIALRMGMEC